MTHTSSSLGRRVRLRRSYKNRKQPTWDSFSRIVAFVIATGRCTWFSSCNRWSGFPCVVRSSEDRLRATLPNGYKGRQNEFSKNSECWIQLWDFSAGYDGYDFPSLHLGVNSSFGGRTFANEKVSFFCQTINTFLDIQSSDCLYSRQLRWRFGPWHRI